MPAFSFLTSQGWATGWRPYVGWVAGTALAAAYIPKALVMAAVWTYQCWHLLGRWAGQGDVPTLPPYPDLGITDLMTLLGTLLGMAGLRTVDKLNNVAADTTKGNSSVDSTQP